MEIAFVEKMRVLGYPQPISMESFRAPNFDLVADILFWLAKRCVRVHWCKASLIVSRYDQNLQVLYDISSEQERIIFIKTIAAFMVRWPRLPEFSKTDFSIVY